VGEKGAQKCGNSQRHLFWKSKDTDMLEEKKDADAQTILTELSDDT